MLGAGEDDALRHPTADQAGVEASVLADEAEWRELIETLPQIVWITRPDGWHVHFNRKWMDFTGLTLEESLGHGWNPPFHPEDRGRAAARWAHATSTGEPYEIEYRLRRADGTYRWMLGRAMPLRDDSGTIVKWFGTCTDIEDLKRAQAEVEQSRALHRLAGSMARLGGWSIDVAADRVTWSEEIYEILDHPHDLAPDLHESIGLYLPEHRSRLEAALAECVASGAPFDLELELENYLGRRLWVRVIGEARHGPDGGVSHVTGALQDISAIKEQSRQKEEMAERLTSTLESLTDGFFTLDRDWRFTYINRRAEPLLRRDRDALLGRRIWDEFPPALGTEVEDAYRTAMTGDVTVLVDNYYYAPLDTWFQVNVYPSPQGLAVYFRDITEQHLAQQALRERVKELGALVAVSGGAQESNDPHELCELTTASLVTAMRHPDHVAVQVALADSACQSGKVPPGSASFTAPVLVNNVERGRIVLSDATGEPFLFEEEALARACAETLGLWLGRHEAADALRRVNHELNEANAQLGQAARLKDDLLSMASHELRTPLTPILGFLEIFQNRGDNLTDDQQRMVEVMRSNARRMLRLVDDLLVVNRAAADVLVSNPEHVEVRQVLLPVIEELGDVLAGVEVSVAGCRLFVDPQHLQQIVLNLLTNASKYGVGPIVVSATQAPNGRVRLSVADHGPGIPPEFQERMWDRFVQKDRGDTRTATGTGLGLAIVKLLVEANGGTVSYRDGSPSGAVFTLELPGHIDHAGDRDAPASESARR